MMQTSSRLRRNPLLYYALRSFVLLVLSFGLTANHPSGAQAKPIPADFARIDAYLASQIKALRIPGLTLAIVKGDQITHLQAFGVADETGRLLTARTPMMLGSVSKSFTALAVMHHSFANHAAALADGLGSGHRYSFGRIIADPGLQPAAMLPAGFLSASAEDMAHYAIAQLNEGHYGAATLLSPQGMATLHRRVEAIDSNYAMGWSNNLQTGFIGHDGDDTRNLAVILLEPAQQQGVVLLANISSLDLSVALYDMTTGVLALLNGKPVPPPSAERSLNQTLYWVGISIPLVLVLGILWSLLHLRRWRKVDGARRWGWFSWLWRVVLPA